MTLEIDSVFRDNVVLGDIHSGKHDPDKAEIRSLLKSMQGSSTNPSIVKGSKAALLATTPANENYGGLVLTGVDAGYYYRSGAAWVFGRAFPDTFAEITLSGSANTQSGSVSTGVNPGSIKVFYADVVTANTGPMTLAVAGGTARDVVNVAGNPLSGGEWSGVVLFFLNSDGDYQLLLDTNSAAASAQSATDAFTYRNQAQGYAALLGGAVAVNYSTVALLLADIALGYTGSGAARIVNVGEIVGAEGFRYQVAASGATTHHVTTTGGVKLFVLPSQDGSFNVRAFGAVGNGTTMDTAPCQKAAGTGKTVLFPEGYNFLINDEIDSAGHGQHFIVNGTITADSTLAANAMNAVIRSRDFDNVEVRGTGVLNGSGKTTNVIHFIADTRNTFRNRVRNVYVTGATTDVTLQRAGILFDNTGGKGSSIRHKEVSVINATVEGVQTHGILTAYCDNVRILENRILGCRNHGHESVNCTDSMTIGNQVSNCLISGLGVGDNTKNWVISDNIITNCAGDGAITCEHNSPRGVISNNVVDDCYGASCINVSYGTPVTGAETIYDISVTGNRCKAKDGSPTIRGLLMYASTTGSEGYGINVADNVFENVFLGLDINYLTHSQFSNNTVTSFQGSTSVGPSGRTAAKFTDIKDSVIDGITIRGDTSDHAVQLLGTSGLQCEHVAVSNIRAGIVPTSKSVVYIQAGIFFVIDKVTARNANYGVEVATAGVAYRAGGITGSYASGLVVGGARAAWDS